MAIYLICWAFFLAGFMPAFLEGGRARSGTGLLIGCVVGALYGVAYAVGCWRSIEWAVRNPDRFKLSQRTWMIIDFTILPIFAIAVLILPGIFSHYTVKFFLRLAGLPR